jgi:tetratricopeptide (TPR) repeat protein
MTNEGDNAPPLIDWPAGWILRSSAWSMKEAGVSDPAWRTLDTPGSLAPVMPEADWSLVFTGPTPAHPVKTLLLATGFEVQSGPSRPHGGLRVLVLEEGALSGRSREAGFPTLLSALHEVHEDAGRSWIQGPAGAVVLATRREQDFARFALVQGPGPLEPLRARADAALSVDLDARWESELARRRAAWMESIGGSAPAHLAAERLAAGLRSPTGLFSRRWMAGDAGNPRASELNQTLPLVAAWLTLDAGVARDVLDTALQRQRAHGLIPAHAGADAGPAGPAAWPLFSQAALLLWNRTGDRDWLGGVLTPLHKYLNAALDYFCRPPHGLPCWSSAAESFWPDAFRPVAASVDLLIFLLNEIEAFQALAAAAPALPWNSELVMEDHRALAGHLEELCWDSDSRAYLDRLIGGPHIRPPGKLSIIPLAWPGLPTPRKFDLQRGLPAALGENGLPDVQRSVLLPLLMFIPGLTELEQWIIRPRPADEAPSSIPDSTAAACQALILHEYQRKTLSQVPARARFMRKMDLNRGLVLGLVSLLLVALIFGVSVLFMHRKSPPWAGFETRMGLAQTLESHGQLEEAAELYRDLRDHFPGRASHLVNQRLANVYLKQGRLAEAESMYRDLLARDPDSPPLLMNLALCLVQQGRESEAAPLYAQVANEFARKYPQLAEHARTALKLLGRAELLADPPPTGSGD